jgi:hypothetical protein
MTPVAISGDRQSTDTTRQTLNVDLPDSMGLTFMFGPIFSLQ